MRPLLSWHVELAAILLPTFLDFLLVPHIQHIGIAIVGMLDGVVAVIV